MEDKVSLGDKVNHRGHKFWCLGQAGSTKDEDCMQLECTYSWDFKIVDFYINRILVEQDELIAELADLYDNELTLRDIMDHETTEAGHRMFLKEHGGEL